MHHMKAVAGSSDAFEASPQIGSCNHARVVTFLSHLHASGRAQGLQVVFVGSFEALTLPAEPHQ